jgi:hypothetical protein
MASASAWLIPKVMRNMFFRELRGGAGGHNAYPATPASATSATATSSLRHLMANPPALGQESLACSSNRPLADLGEAIKRLDAMRQAIEIEFVLPDND